MMFLVTFILLIVFAFLLVCYMSGGAIINYLTSSKKGRLKTTLFTLYVFDDVP